MRIITYLLLLVIILIGITFALLNPNIVTVHYYIGEETLPLSLLLVVIFALGCFLGLLVGGWLLLKVKIKIYRLRHRLKVAEKEIQNLRAIPLQDRH
ncbi:MAG: putative membrane protein [uncultured bacterium]|nr:MAG: putative membrane protein [uncultured bacterium]